MIAAGFGWNLRNARAERRLAIQHVPLENLDLDMLSARIRRELAQGSIRRVVIDALAELVSASREADRGLRLASGVGGVCGQVGEPGRRCWWRPVSPRTGSVG